MEHHLQMGRHGAPCTAWHPITYNMRKSGECPIKQQCHLIYSLQMSVFFNLIMYKLVVLLWSPLSYSFFNVRPHQVWCVLHFKKTVPRQGLYERPSSTCVCLQSIRKKSLLIYTSLKLHPQTNNGIFYSQMNKLPSNSF